MKKALIVVDMLNDFVHKDGALFFQQGADIIESVRKRIEAHRAEENLIIFLCDAHAKDDKEFDRFPPHAIENTTGADIVKEIATAGADYGHYISKTRYSGFYGTALNTKLTFHAPFAEIEVVGVCTSICVMDTVGGLANRDYDNIVVPLNAVADFDNQAHHSALARMGTLYGAEVVMR